MNTIKTILFVENDPVALEMYRNRLQREGFQVQSALDGLEALKALAQHAPDLVMIDSALPKLSGMDVLKFIRTNPRIQNTPVALFSNGPAPEGEDAAVFSGPTRRLLKTDCTFAMLLRTIHEMLAAGQSGIAAAVPPAPSATPPNGASAESSDSDRGQTEFLVRAQAETPKIREHCFAYIKSPASPASLQHLPSLHQLIHFLSTNAGNVGFARLALLTNAFDTLLSEIIAKPSWVTPSILQTIAQAVDCLGYLLKSNANDLAQPMPQAKVLAVDDDAVCNHVIVNTLKRAGFDAKSVSDPHVALQFLESTRYDLILLDISMPGMTGFELCEKLRAFPHGKTTPVIFITGHNNFDNRKQSVLSGGHDFITKPVSPSELALKATIHVLKNRVQRAPTQTSTEPGTNPRIPLPLTPPDAVVNPGASAATPTYAVPAESGIDAQLNGLPQPVFPPPPTPTTITAIGGAPISFQPAASPEIPIAASADPSEVAAAAAAFLATTESGNSEPGTPIWTQEAPPAESPAPFPAEAMLQPAAPTALQPAGSEIRISIPEPQFAPAPEASNGVGATEGSHAAGVLETPGNAELGVLPEQSFDPLPATPLVQPAFNRDSSVTSTALPADDSEHWNSTSPLAELPDATALAAASAEAQSRLVNLEQELTYLRQEHGETRSKLASEEQSAAAAQQELADLRSRLSQATTELDQAKASHEQLFSDRARIETEWRDQLNAAQAAQAQVESRLKDKENHAAQLQEQLANLQRERDEAHTKLASEQQTAASASAEAQSRLANLEQELTHLRQEHGETQSKLASEQQAGAAVQQELADLRSRLSQATTELDQAKAVGNRHAADMTRLEEEHLTLMEAKEALNTELARERANRLAHAQEFREKHRKLVDTLRENILQLHNSLSREGEAADETHHS